MEMGSNPRSGAWLAETFSRPVLEFRASGPQSALETLVLPPDQNHSGRATTVTILRVVLSLHIFAVLTQAVFAGQFLSGVETPVVLHEWTAWFVLALSVVQIAVSAVFIRQGGPLWLLVASIFILLAEALQTGTGYGRFLGVHIPLGVFVFGALTWLVLWSFRKQAPAGGQAI